MTNDYSYNEKIDQFLEGNLSVEENDDFIRSMQTDKELTDMVKIQRVANEVIRIKQLLRLKEKMEADFSGTGRFNPRNSFLLFSLASLIAGVGMYWYVNEKKVTSVKEAHLSAVTIINADTVHLSNSIILPATTASKLNQEKNQVVNSLAKDSIQPTENLRVDLPVVTDIPNTKQNSNPDLVNRTIIYFDKKVVDCSSFALHHAIKASGSCSEEPTGKISIDVSEIKGGVSPYLISVSSIASSFTDKTDFLYVRPGNYIVSIKDKNECLLKKEIEVEERECAKANVFAFTPELEKWKIPVQQKKYGTIKIFSKSGILVHLSELSFESENYWDGISSGGQPLEIGYYTYIINYTDGEQETGSVSIVR